MLYSAVLIVPDALRSKANLLGAALGWGPESYTVSLHNAATLALTHHGARADVTETFVDLIAAAETGNLPAVNWAAQGLSAADVTAVLAALFVDLSPDPAHPDVPVLWGAGHFDPVIAALDLVRL
jgi:hypothetical protein